MDFPDLSSLDLNSNPSGLEWADLESGSGPEIRPGSNALMHYTGWLTDGSKFDSSLDRGEPFPLEDVGNAPVIAGWNEGLVGMKQGGRRVLSIPAELGYGEQEIPGLIPANSQLVFVVDAVEVSS